MVVKRDFFYFMKKMYYKKYLTFHKLFTMYDDKSSLQVHISNYFLMLQALKKVGQKLTLASIGNLSDVPYLDELK